MYYSQVSQTLTIPRDSYISSVAQLNTPGQDHVEYQTNGGRRRDYLDVNTDDNTLLISNTGDRDNRWIAENKAATDFFVTNNKLKVLGSSELFLKFENDGSNNRVIVKDLVEEDPGWHVIPQKDYSLKFNRFYGMNSIETILSDGASIRVNVKAANYVGEDNKWSNIVIPEVLADGLSDVITLSEGSKGNDVTVTSLRGLNNTICCCR